MSDELFDRSADLRRLREEGYCVEKVGGFLLMRDVPYVDRDRKVQKGTLVSDLSESGNQTHAPGNHQVHFVGQCPCDASGKPLNINVRAANIKLPNGMIAAHSFSSKLESGSYPEYHAKMTTYANLLAGPASVIDPMVSAKSVRVPASDSTSVFKYTETASDRVGIGELTRKLEDQVVAIIGVGGTGSYVLDSVVKTPVHEIRLFDSDLFLQHNEFRAPGAASIDQLRQRMYKVDYFAQMYDPMRHGIVPHAIDLDATNVDLLDGVTSAFICVDTGAAKKAVVEKLEALNASFVDVGMGLDLVDGTLGGILRVTASSPGRRDHLRADLLSTNDAEEGDLYGSNIQVADLNGLNAMLAVVRWKKMLGFYRDYKSEPFSTYTTDTNKIANGGTE